MHRKSGVKRCTRVWYANENQVLPTLSSSKRVGGGKGKVLTPVVYKRHIISQFHFLLFFFIKCFKGKFYLLLCSLPVLRLDMLYSGWGLKVKLLRPVCQKNMNLEKKEAFIFWEHINLQTKQEGTFLKTCDGVLVYICL